MLLVNGAIAAFNGLLVASYKIWCECVLGGTCCDGQCRCDEGDCCGDTWHPDSDPDMPCAAGHFFLRWGEYEQCCGCVPDEIFDGRVGENVSTLSVKDDLCCDCTNALHLPYADFEMQAFGVTVPAGFEIGCTARCCIDGECTTALEFECADLGGEWLAGCCGLGCPASCCTEDASGVVSCNTENTSECTGVVDEEPCESACKGACCVDGEPHENSPMQQAECDAVGGCWWGVGSTECGTEGFCRPPFDEDCCESVTSSAARLTFRGPRKKRCPELDGCGFQVTATVKTAAPVYVHGGLFGSPYEACTETVTFLLCNDEFHVTPAPCSGALQGLEIEVCWDESAESESEVLRFHCCQDTTYLLGNCDCDCVTTLLYEGIGCTSNAVVQMRGDAAIEANGTGPLVLTANVTHGGSCSRTLTLRGTSGQANQMSGAITNGSGTTSVEKRGSGLWRLSGNSSYAGRLSVLEGTLVVAANVNSSGASPFGTATASGSLPVVGGAAGTASLLVEGGRTIDRGLWVASGSGTAVLGNTGAGTSIFPGGNDITLGRNVTLVASGSGTAVFANNWVNASGPVAFTIGSDGNAGIVVLESELPASTGVLIVFGTAQIQTSTDNRINSATPVTVGSSLGSATLDLNGQSQSLSTIAFVGTGSQIIGGTLRLVGTPTVTVAGTGHQIASGVALDAATTFNAGNAFTVSGAISGTAGLTKTGIGTLTLSGVLSYTGDTDIAAGSLVTQSLVSGPAKFAAATFTLSGLTVAFSSTPASGEQYRLLPGTTVNTYAAVTLTGAGSATATYNSTTSTLTID